MAKGIFVSYRRTDSAGHAGRIYDRLEQYYGDEMVFRDIEDIAAGDDFVKVIRDRITAYDTMLVIVGPGWLSATDESGRRRLDDPDDYVRLEIATALERPRVRVIPVLVNGARMPRANELPKELAPLAQRNAVELLDTRFQEDVEQLIRSLGGKRAGWLRGTLITAGAVAVLAAATGIVIKSLIGEPEVGASVTLYQGGGEVEDGGRQAVSSYTPPDSADPFEQDTTPNQYRIPFTVRYDYERSGRDGIRVSTALPYRELVRSGGPIEGGAATLYWDWPALSIQVVNNSDRVIQLREIHLDIQSSEIDLEPLVMVRRRLWQRAVFGLVNYGWGRMVDQSVGVAIVKEEECRTNDWRDLPRQRISPSQATTTRLRYIGVESTEGGAPGVETIVNVASLLPRELLRDPLGCVFGLIDYEDEAGDKHSVRFKTLVMINGSAPLAAVSVSAQYLVFLEAGRSGYVKSVSIAQEVRPTGVEHFLLRLGTDKSASFEMSVSLQTVADELVEAGDVSIEILTPVYDPYGLRDPETRR